MNNKEIEIHPATASWPPSLLILVWPCLKDMERLERVLCGQMSTDGKLSLYHLCMCVCVWLGFIFILNSRNWCFTLVPYVFAFWSIHHKKKKARTQMENRCETGFCQTRFLRARAVIFFWLKWSFYWLVCGGCYAPRDGKVKRELRRKGSQRGHRKRQFVEGRSPFLLA